VERGYERQTSVKPYLGLGRWIHHYLLKKKPDEKTALDH
jgi:hypothetical protein